MKKRVAINGFGRIGRLTLRNLLENKNIEVVAINDLTDNTTLAHLFKYDSIHGTYPGAVSADADSIKINDLRIPVFSSKNPQTLPWASLKVDIVLECTGIFKKRVDCQKHRDAGAKKVILSAPSSDADVPTIVLGVNDELLHVDDWMISNASCTTNCLAPLVKVIEENWQISSGVMTTIHAYTGDQNIHDAPHNDLRRARAAAINMVPTSTGAAKALARVLPDAKGKIHATSLRIPIPTGSLVELTCNVKKVPNLEEINAAFKSASIISMRDIMAYSEDPIVSSDIVSSPYSCIFDAPLTQLHMGMIKVTAWYDNESGYSARLAQMADLVSL